MLLGVAPSSNGNLSNYGGTPDLLQGSGSKSAGGYGDAIANVYGQAAPQQAASASSSQKPAPFAGQQDAYGFGAPHVGEPPKQYGHAYGQYAAPQAQKAPGAPGSYLGVNGQHDAIASLSPYGTSKTS